MKTCFKCGSIKKTDEFYHHPHAADRRSGKCKECTKTDATKNRNKNIQRVRQYDRERGNRQSPEYLKGYRAENPEKYEATTAVNNAIRDGNLIKQDDCHCGEPTKHAHHDDYSKPLDVRWLCSACHSQWHQDNQARIKP